MFEGLGPAIVGLCLIVIAFALFVPKKEKKPKLTLLKGGKKTFFE